VRSFHRFLDGALETREFIAGDAFSIADILALTTIDFASALVELPLNPTHTHLAAWHQRIATRPSLQAASF
jgi:glutathione S-transferase